MPSLPHSLIRHYDSIGWIPTIRGCLSLDLIDKAKCILGDVDKYSVRFKQYYGLESAHYLIATSLNTVNDTKGGTDYVRSFRYIFTGSINDKKATQEFLKNNKLEGDESLKAYIEDEGLLIGRLAIVAEDGHKLSSSEVILLKGLKDLTKLNNNYLELFHVKAASMEKLKKVREAMYERWKLLAETARQIEEEKEIDRPIFRFDVALTRDGILLLKDVTCDEWKKTYAAQGTPDDYTQNMPIHRLFKDAMNYIKYLFHSNYHHNEDHDTYLPASNLHPIIDYNDKKNKASKFVCKLLSCPEKLDLYKVFRHQLDAFLVPVIRLKREGFSSYTVDPKGIILYAKAFIRVFKENNLVNECVAVKAQEHCDILEKEIEQMTAEHSAIVRAFITNHNPFIILPALLAFVLACLETANLLHLYVKQYVISIMYVHNPYYAVGKFLLLAFLGYILYIISRTRALTKKFKLKEKSKNRLFVDSNLKENSGRFSYRYKFYIFYNTIMLRIIRPAIRIIRPAIGIIRTIIIIAFLMLAIYVFICFFYGKWIVL